jgi:hypothetical protein
MKPLTSLQLGWAAGVWEGEGCAMPPTPSYRSQVVTITQKDPWLCYKFQSLFGGNVREQHITATTKRPFESHQCTWRMSGPNARGFLMTIYQFLSPRRKTQVRKALEISNV